MMTTMKMQEQNVDCSGRKELLEQAFGVIMDLTREEKQELLDMWREYNDRRTTENADCNLAC